MKKRQYKDWENETHVITIFKVVNKLEDQDYDPVASFFDCDRDEALSFAKKYKEEHPSDHIFVYRAAIEAWNLLFDSDPDATDKALLNMENATSVLPKSPHSLDDIESEW